MVQKYRKGFSLHYSPHFRLLAAKKYLSVEKKIKAGLGGSSSTWPLLYWKFHKPYENPLVWWKGDVHICRSHGEEFMIYFVSIYSMSS